MKKIDSHEKAIISLKKQNKILWYIIRWQIILILSISSYAFYCRVNKTVIQKNKTCKKITKALSRDRSWHEYPEDIYQLNYQSYKGLHLWWELSINENTIHNFISHSIPLVKKHMHKHKIATISHILMWMNEIEYEYDEMKKQQAWMKKSPFENLIIIMSWKENNIKQRLEKKSLEVQKNIQEYSKVYNYVQTPYQTLIEGRGDCDDKTLLAFVALTILWYECAYIQYNNPDPKEAGHVFLCIKECENLESVRVWSHSYTYANSNRYTTEVSQWTPLIWNGEFIKSLINKGFYQTKFITNTAILKR